MKYPLDLGCTEFRHSQIGINAIVNARAGLQHLNDFTHNEIELRRDARKVQEHSTNRVIIRQFNSKQCAKRLQHLIFQDDI